VGSRNGSGDAAYIDPLFGIHLTGGSNSIKNSFTQYRELGARARAMLLGAAAARWKVDVATLRTQGAALMAMAPDFRASVFVRNRPFKFAEDSDHLLDGLRKAGLSG